MKIISNLVGQVFVSLIFGGILSETVSVTTGSNSDSGLLVITGFIFCMVFILVIRYWWPRFKMMRDIKKSEERDNSDLLDE